MVKRILMLLCQGLAGRGWCRGDAFIVGAIGVVVALTVVFILFPVAIILTSAFRDEEDTFALAQFADKFFDRSVWGLDCLSSTLRCGVAWNTLILAIAVGFGATALGRWWRRALDGALPACCAFWRCCRSLRRRL
jgi:iron(III) transport system permease protein